MDVMALLAGPFGILILCLAVAWSVLMFFAPFFWYGAWYRAKQTHIESIAIRSLLSTLVANKYSASASAPVNTTELPPDSGSDSFGKYG